MLSGASPHQPLCRWKGLLDGQAAPRRLCEVLGERRRVPRAGATATREEQPSGR